MPTVAIVADTHVPSREPAVPEWVRERVRTADYVVHSGDFDADETLATFEDVPTPLTAVHGNVDPDLGLSSVATLDVADVRFVVTHGTGAPQDWDDRVAATAREHAGGGETVAVGGHIHQVVDREHDGMRLLNPGSATGADPAVEATMLTAEVDGDEVDVTVHRS